MESTKPDHFLINVNNKEELVDIAEKLGCQVTDVIYAIEMLQTNRRSDVYSWIIDETFKAHLKK